MTRFTPSNRGFRVALCGVLAAAVFATGCRPAVDRSGRSKGTSKTAEKAKDVAADEKKPVVITPAAAQPPAAAASRSTGSKAVIREVVSSSLPHAVVAEAEDDFIQQARLRIAERLKELDPPVRHAPPPSAVREQHVRKDTRNQRKPNDAELSAFRTAGINGESLVYVEYAVEVSEDQLRHLRMLDRVTDALRVVGGLLVVCAAAFLFLRADEWTRGYLTSWLGLLAGLGIVAGLIAVLTLRLPH